MISHRCQKCGTFVKKTETFCSKHKHLELLNAIQKITEEFENRENKYFKNSSLFAVKAKIGNIFLELPARGIME